MATLSIHNLRVCAPGSKHVLLDDISCTVSGGEILAVVGPNGAGKSTLLQTLAGDIETYEGSIDFANVSSAIKCRARQLAVLPQFSLLSFPFRVDEVVRLARIPHQTGNAVDEEIIAAALDAMDISCLSHRLYTELSGGEKQRVQLARVLAQVWRAEDADGGQRILLLDEPTTALDLG
ncbi:MAG: ATP-binding cassette domain-containing protein, partial [Gammaproteobacteria bacterium]|nr:ATP-binding cassette domain-containing protein [Gammaproteobacteria bacterium]